MTVSRDTTYVPICIDRLCMLCVLSYATLVFHERPLVGKLLLKKSTQLLKNDNAETA